MPSCLYRDIGGKGDLGLETLLKYWSTLPYNDFRSIPNGAPIIQNVWQVNMGCSLIMMSWHGNIFRVRGHLWGEFDGYLCISITKCQKGQSLMLSLLSASTSHCINSPVLLDAMPLNMIAVDQGSKDDTTGFFSLHVRVFMLEMYNLDILSRALMPTHSNTSDWKLMGYMLLLTKCCIH